MSFGDELTTVSMSAHKKMVEKLHLFGGSSAIVIIFRIGIGQGLSVNVSACAMCR